MNADAVPATSTNADLFVVPISGGESIKITIESRAPIPARNIRPTANGSAYRSQARAGYESDRWRLVVLERATGTSEHTHRNAGPLGRKLHLVARFECVVLHRARSRTADHQMIPATGGATRVIVSGASTLDDMQFTADGKTMIYTRQSGSAPTEIYRASFEPAARRWRSRT